jgi:UDP-N-acetylmuramoyl-tripeptide--D-alanyl-D-alanine ligase
MATPIPPNEASFTIDDAAVLTKGTIVRRGPDVGTGVVSDTRAIATGNVFIALRGETHDAHAFLDAACARGPAYVVVERGRAPACSAVGVIEVDDTLVALGDLARGHLENWRSAGHVESRRVVAITGSAGKTTTKELAAALLGAVAPTHYTAGNLNNRVGVPFVVLGLLPRHRFAVLEMGMSLPGELDKITSFARPDVSLVTNVGVAHAEGVGGREGVACEKGAVYRALREDGIAIVNADDDYVIGCASSMTARTTLRFAKKAGSTYQLVQREPRGEAGSLVVIEAVGRRLEIALPLPGEAAAIDLAAALAAQEAASGVKLSVDRIEAALATIDLAGRATIKRLGSDILVLDDTYNANPASMRAALATLGELGQSRRRVAVLGEMKELGTHAETEHDSLGEAIASAGVALAIGCGGLISRSFERASALGVECIAASSTSDAAREATARVRAGDAVLVKGSRSVGAERVVAALIETWPAGVISDVSGSA